MTPIILDQEDLLTIWKITDNDKDVEPFKSMYSFLNYFSLANPADSHLKNKYDYNPSTDHNKNLVDEFCEVYANKVKVDELFLFLIDGMPSDNNSTKINKLFEYFNKKYPDFFTQLTQAMNTKQHINYHESVFVTGWMKLAQVNRVEFKHQEIFHFIKENLFDNVSSIVKKISIIDKFDDDKAETFVKDLLVKNQSNPKIIKIAQNYLDKHHISHEKIVIPLFEESEEHLYHYHIQFKPEAIVQKFNLSQADAVNVLFFTAYYLGEHAYYGVRAQRSGDPKNITLQISTPYEHAFKDAKAIYHDAIPIILGEFLTTENLAIIKKDQYSEPLATYLKEYIKTAKLKNSLDATLPDKEVVIKSPKI